MQWKYRDIRYLSSYRAALIGSTLDIDTLFYSLKYTVVTLICWSGAIIILPNPTDYFLNPSFSLINKLHAYLTEQHIWAISFKQVCLASQVTSPIPSSWNILWKSFHWHIHPLLSINQGCSCYCTMLEMPNQLFSKHPTISQSHSV